MVKLICFKIIDLVVLHEKCEFSKWNVSALRRSIFMSHFHAILCRTLVDEKQYLALNLRHGPLLTKILLHFLYHLDNAFSSETLYCQLFIQAKLLYASRYSIIKRR